MSGKGVKRELRRIVAALLYFACFFFRGIPPLLIPSPQQAFCVCCGRNGLWEEQSCDVACYGEAGCETWGVNANSVDAVRARRVAENGKIVELRKFCLNAAVLGLQHLWGELGEEGFDGICEVLRWETRRGEIGRVVGGSC